MTPVVTGASGMIGRAVVRTLRMDGHEPRPLRHAVDGTPWRLGDPAQASILAGADALIHLAWDLDPGMADICATGSLRLFDQCRESGIRRIIFVSSQSAGSDRPTRYGAAKRAVEEALRADGGALSVRPGLVWSDPPEGTFRSLIGARFLGWTLTFATPAVLHPVHVDDLAAVLARAAAHDGPSGLLEIGAVRPVTAASIVAMALGPGHQLRLPRVSLEYLASALSPWGTRGRSMADRARGLAVLRPMRDPQMDVLGVSCRALSRLGQH